MKPVFKLSDAELSSRIAELHTEAARRSKSAINDAATIIKGQEYPKRAIVVAAAGGHSVCFFGNPGTGKTLLRALAFDLGVEQSYELHPCPCGWFQSVDHACKCDVAAIQKHIAKNKVVADLHVEVCKCPVQEMQARNVTPISYYKDQIERSNKHPIPAGITQEAQTLCDYAQRELGIDHGEMERIQAVARTIARLDGNSTVQGAHACEAIGYRRPKGW